MRAERVVPQVGERVRYVIEGTVTGYYGGNRILTLRTDDGSPKTLKWDAGALYEDAGITLEVLQPAVAP